VVTETDQQIPAEPLRRQLSVFALWLLAINGIIGAGIFGIPATAQALAGDFSPWLFVICALLIAPIVLCFAELSSAFANTGGPVLYARSGFGPFAGFQAGWAFYVARLTAFAANLNLLVVSIGYFWPASNGPLVRAGLLAAISAAMIWVNIVGARAAIASLSALTALKLLPLLALALYGAVHVDGAVFTQIESAPAAADLGAALLLVIYAFVGFESSVVPAGEARHPQRDMPRALIAALLVSAALYALIQLAAQTLVPTLASSERPLLAAGEAWLGPAGALLVALGIVASVGGNLLGSMFSTPRISYRLARDGQLPDWFGAVHSRHLTPANSIICYGVAAFGLAVSGSFVWLAVMSVMTRLLLYLACVASMPAIRRQAGNRQGLQLPGGWLLPALAVAICLGLLSQVEWRAVVATAALLAVGSALYLSARRNADR
jgi:amino acid transporter